MCSSLCTLIGNTTNHKQAPGTRKEELLVDKGTLSKMWVLRRILNPMGVVDSMEFLIDKLKDSKRNDDFFDSMNT